MVALASLGSGATPMNRSDVLSRSSSSHNWSWIEKKNSHPSLDDTLAGSMSSRYRAYNPQSRRRAPNTSLEEWEKHRPDIIRLYIEESLRIKDVLERLRANGFDVTPKQFKHRISQWGLRKNSTFQARAERLAVSPSRLSTFQSEVLEDDLAWTDQGESDLGSATSAHSYALRDVVRYYCPAVGCTHKPDGFTKLGYLTNHVSNFHPSLAEQQPDWQQNVTARSQFASTETHHREPNHSKVASSTSMAVSPMVRQEHNRSSAMQATVTATGSGSVSRGYQYNPLSTERSVRLLRLDGSGGHVRLTVESHDLDEVRGQYTALSYVWGDWNASSHILVDDTTIRVPSNLSRMLDALARSRQHRRKSELFWVDAICINQNDLFERSSQIKIIGEVYASASQVLVWLNHGSTESSLAAVFIEDVQDLSHVDSYLRDPKYEALRNDFSLLLQNAWFKRVWTLQEIALARDVQFLVGDSTFPLQSLARALEYSKADGTGFNAHIDIDLRSGEADIVQSLSLTEKRLSVRNAPFSLIQLVRLTAYVFVDNLRDKIVSLLNVANDVTYADLPGIPELSEAELSKHFTVLIIRKSRLLDALLLPMVSTQEAMDKSWPASTKALPLKDVGDNTVTRRGADLLCIAQNPELGFQRSSFNVARALERPYSASGSGEFALHTWRAPPHEFPDVLSVRGSVLATVSQKGDLAIRGCVPISWAEFAGWGYFETPAPDSFWRMLVADRTASGRSPPEHWAQGCEFIFQQAEQGDSIDTTELMATVPSPIHPMVVEIRRTVWGRRLVRTSTDFLALAPGATRPGDSIVVLYGCSVPVVLRQSPDKDHYMLVGECFVYGMMDGEALKYCADNGIEAQEFLLV